MNRDGSSFLRYKTDRFLDPFNLTSVTGMSVYNQIWQKIQLTFQKTNENHWAHLSRFTNLLIILNISLFFLTELVTRQSYYYTYFSLFFLALVQLALLIPLGLFDRLWFYLSCLVLEILGFYFLATSVRYWVATNKV